MPIARMGLRYSTEDRYKLCEQSAIQVLQNGLLYGLVVKRNEGVD